ncbi:MAG TPA: FlgD immunoglobulin-like domain containing protein, partial [Bacteroidota bacterium]
IYCSTGGGPSWRTVNTGLDDYQITSLALSGANLLAGSAASAVWRRPLYEIIPPDPPVATTAINVSAIGFTATWNVSAGAARYILDVSPDTAFGSFVTGYNGLDVGNVLGTPVNSLAPQTTYFYRVRAANGVGPGGNSNTISVRTIQSAPSRPTSRAPSNITQTGFTANWAPAGGASTYHLDVATDIAFSSYLPGYKDHDVGVDTSFGVIGLTPSTDYYYQVRGVNGAGPGPTSNVTMVTTLANVPAAPTATSPTGVSTSGFTANWNSVSGATSYDLDVAYDGSFTSFVFGLSSRNAGFATSYPVSGVTDATIYYYRVRGRNTGGPRPSSNIVSATTLRSYSATFMVSTTVPFSSANKALSDYQSPDYQLIGIPGNSGQQMSDILGGTQGTDWEIYWDNGTSVPDRGYYVRLKSGDSRFTASTGRAFWLLHLGDWSLSSRSVSTAVLDTAGNATIDLTAGAGFNLITNPFLYSIPWSRITSANGITDSIRAWTSSGWARAASFDPYKGYLFFNGAGKASLHVPLNATLPKTGLEKLQEPGSWRVDVVARCGAYADQTTSFGVSPDGLPGLDRYEQRKPRHFTEIPDVYFRRQEWDARFPEFATDVRGPLAGLGTWDLSVRSEEMKGVDIEFRGIDRIPAGLDVMMLDELAGYAQDLRISPRYTLNPHSQVTTLKVAVGNPGEVRALASSVLPSRFALRQNYPNPFNPSTTIPVDIPARSEIVLEIYDLLGRRVLTLFEGEISAGRHYFEWNGANSSGFILSSGVYFARLSVRNGRTLVTRMNLVR